MVNILVIINLNFNHFTIYEILLENVIKVFPKNYKNKTKMPGKDLFIRITSYINHIQGIGVKWLLELFKV